MPITPVIIFLTSKHPNRCGLYKIATTNDQLACEEIYSIPVFESSTARYMAEFCSFWSVRAVIGFLTGGKILFIPQC